ncbi:hypothetical protein RHGRI_023445 [Rhododendron griersonianum]|uniref:Uncharacterized protein n=1 Tax=Rhododendron griersonianum TaxID=479676 RepID=A0AAV6J917_9ERIC|nr:hypothetical protein RHGRI_023445 [Rhododendron griersonianum]
MRQQLQQNFTCSGAAAESFCRSIAVLHNSGFHYPFPNLQKFTGGLEVAAVWRKPDTAQDRAFCYVHDELVLEADPSVIKEAGWLLQMSMERAASLLSMSSEIALCFWDYVPLVGIEGKGEGKITIVGKEKGYRKTELLSDHRVTDTDMVEAEGFSPRKLQRALTLTDAEIKNQEAVANEGSDAGMSNLSFRKFELGFIEMMDMEIGFK